MRRAGAPAFTPTADRGRHEKSRQRSGWRLMVDIALFNCTLPPAPTGGRAEHRVISHSTPVATVDCGPPLGERQVAHEHPLT